MSSLVVGGVAIKVAVSSPRWSRMDAVDRVRAFDNTFRASQTGGAVRVWDFETPAVLAATEGETYKAALSTVASQLCSGDILAIPTMCSAELTDGVPTSVAGDPYVVLSFSLHEVQPAKVLLRYSPGDTITGESFTRAAPPATYRNSGGAVSEAATDVKRDAHYDVNDLVANSPSLLLEGGDTNIAIWNRDLTNAAWTKTNMTATQDQVGADSAVNSATRLTATAANGTATNSEAGSGSRQMSAYVRRITGTGVIQMTTDAAGADWVTITITAGWTRFSIPPKTITTPNFGFRIVTSGDEIAVDYVQNETGAFPSSVIPTTTVAVARAVDVYSLPFTAPPDEITVYAKFIELGSLLGAGRVFSIASAADANPRFVLGSAVSFYQAAHITAAASVTSALAVVPAIGDTVELMARLFGDGSVDVTQSINGGAATSGAQSAANALAAAWSDDILWINSAGTAGSRGYAAYKSLKVVAGSRSLAEMRAL